jgi:hypothetical protein
VTYRSWRTILASVLISFSLSVVSDQCSASSDTADFSYGSTTDINSVTNLRPLLGVKRTYSPPAQNVRL